MSSNTPCNFCIFRMIKTTADANGETITTKEADFKAIKEFNNGSGGIDVFVDGEFVAWLMAIPESCNC